MDAGGGESTDLGFALDDGILTAAEGGRSGVGALAVRSAGGLVAGLDLADHGAGDRLGRVAAAAAAGGGDGAGAGDRIEAGPVEDGIGPVMAERLDRAGLRVARDTRADAGLQAGRGAGGRGRRSPIAPTVAERTGPGSGSGIGISIAVEGYRRGICRHTSLRAGGILGDGAGRRVVGTSFLMGANRAGKSSGRAAGAGPGPGRRAVTMVTGPVSVKGNDFIRTVGAVAVSITLVIFRTAAVGIRRPVIKLEPGGSRTRLADSKGRGGGALTDHRLGGRHRRALTVGAVRKTHTLDNDKGLGLVVVNTDKQSSRALDFHDGAGGCT